MHSPYPFACLPRARSRIAHNFANVNESCYISLVRNFFAAGPVSATGVGRGGEGTVPGGVAAVLSRPIYCRPSVRSTKSRFRGGTQDPPSIPKPAAVGPQLVMLDRSSQRRFPWARQRRETFPLTCCVFSGFASPGVTRVWAEGTTNTSERRKETDGFVSFFVLPRERCARQHRVREKAHRV